MDIARPLRDETHRSHALREIAENELYAGQLDAAFATALDIQVTEERPVGLALPFFGFRDPLLKEIAYRYARKDDWKKAYAALDSQSVHGDYYPEP